MYGRVLMFIRNIVFVSDVQEFSLYVFVLHQVKIKIKLSVSSP